MTHPKLKLWADAVKIRDGACMECGSDKDLHAHHIFPKSSHPELALDVGNGKTLCYGCHKSEHEKNRPLRIRSNKPQRRTLQAVIDALTGEVSMLKKQNEKLRHLVGECSRGVCQSSIKRKNILSECG
jgi:hypothetical protein